MGGVPSGRDGNREERCGTEARCLTYKPGTRICVVLAGTLVDPYSGKTIAFALANLLGILSFVQGTI